MVAIILADYEPKWRCMTLNKPSFNIFVQILAYFSGIQKPLESSGPWALEAAGRQPTFLKSGSLGGGDPQGT